MKHSQNKGGSSHKKVDLEETCLELEASVTGSNDNNERNHNDRVSTEIPNVKVFYGKKRLVDCMKNIIQNGYFL